MNRMLARLSAASLIAAAASAQCFESNFGTLIGSGDDSAFPSTTTANPMNITFPMGGTFAAYTHITVNTNGCAFLWNAATGVVGATATGYSTTAATQLSNLRGAVGGSPRIAPLWRDLNLVVANGGGLWLNNTIPGKCVVTWANAVNFGTTTPIFTVQAQLFDTGEVKFFYSGTAQSTAASIVGVSQGGGIAAVAGVNLNPGPNSSATRLIFEQFAASAVDLQNTGLSFLPNGGGYDQSAAPCVPANNSNYGAGCYAVPAQPNSSVAQLFAGSPAAKAALDGNSMTFALSGGTYTASWNAGGASGFVAPGGGATTLVFADADDGNVAITSSLAVPIPGGSTVDWNVSVNGILTAGTVANNPGDFTPALADLGTAPGLGFYTWRDWNVGEAGSGPIQTEEIGNVLYITWNNVEAYGTPSPNPGLWQYQVDMVSGDVTMVWVSFEASTSTSSVLVGGTLAGVSATPVSISLATQLPVTLGPDVPATVPMAISASPTPVSTVGSGTLLNYALSNIPLACPSPAPVFHFGVLMLSMGQDLAGTDLLTGYMIDAPGCNLHIASLDVPIAFVDVVPSQTVGFGVPAGVPSGFTFFAQAAALVCPYTLPNGQNGAGITVSNGVRSYVNSF